MDAKRNKMTGSEKAFRTGLKKEMQEKGILPPDKPKLNRKKYVEEAVKEWNEKDKDFFIWDIYLHEAISIMLTQTDENFRVSREAIGAAKCLKLALRLKEFRDGLRAEGRTEYTVREKAEYIRDILKA